MFRNGDYKTNQLTGFRGGSWFMLVSMWTEAKHEDKKLTKTTCRELLSLTLDTDARVIAW